MASLDRSVLEKAANAYLASLMQEVDQPRDFPEDNFAGELAYQVEETGNVLEQHDARLKAHDYSDGDQASSMGNA